MFFFQGPNLGTTTLKWDFLLYSFSHVAAFIAGNYDEDAFYVNEKSKRSPRVRGGSTRLCWSAGVARVRKSWRVADPSSVASRQPHTSAISRIFFPSLNPRGSILPSFNRPNSTLNKFVHKRPYLSFVIWT